MDRIGEDCVEWGSLVWEGKGQMWYLICHCKLQVFRYKSNSHPSKKTLLFATDGDDYRKPYQSNWGEQVTMWHPVPTDVTTTHRLRVRETKCLLWDYVSWKCQGRLHAWNLNKMAIWTRTGMLSWGKKSMKPYPGTKNHRQLWNAESKRNSVSQERFSNTTWSALKLYAYK